MLCSFSLRMEIRFQCHFALRFPHWSPSRRLATNPTLLLQALIMKATAQPRLVPSMSGNATRSPHSMRTQGLLWCGRLSLRCLLKFLCCKSEKCDVDFVLPCLFQNLNPWNQVAAVTGSAAPKVSPVKPKVFLTCQLRLPAQSYTKLT